MEIINVMNYLSGILLAYSPKTLNATLTEIQIVQIMYFDRIRK
jgi:hypothetical protein